MANPARGRGDRGDGKQCESSRYNCTAPGQRASTKPNHTVPDRGAVRDKPLSFHWRADDVAWLATLDLPSVPSKRHDRARASILLDVVQEAVGRGRWISYSRTRAYYSGKRRVSNHTVPDRGAVRDKPLSFHWRADDVAWLATLDLPSVPSKRHDRARASILLDVVQEAVGRGRWISYSRTRAYYSGKRRYHGTAYSFRTVVPMVDELAYLGWIKNHKAPASPTGGWQSRMKATPHLLAAVTIPLVRFYPIETIRLKDSTKHLIDYRDTAKTLAMRRSCSVINEALGRQAVTIEAPGAVRDGPVIRCGDHVLYPSMTSVYRVFNRDFQHGGRFYGGWWQNAKSKDRKYLRINGQPTVELDYSQLHPRLTYRMAGKPLTGDAYDIEG